MRWHILFKTQQYKKGDFVIQPEEVCNYVSFVNRGLIKFSVEIEGKEFVGALFHENTYLSEYESFLTRQPTHSFMQALEDSELVHLDYESMQKLYTQFPETQYFERVIA